MTRRPSSHALPDALTLSRRDCLKWGLGATLAGASGGVLMANVAEAAEKAVMPKAIAAIVTIYFHNSHADVLLTKMLEGWKHDGGPGPALKLASVYIDQPEGSEFGLQMLAKHKIPIFKTIADAVTVGGSSIPVDGVLSIGEHGSYPTNEIGQQLYPRRRFMEEITATFEKHQRVVPIFNDKHLGPVWSDAKWMYDRARELKIPFMAGSSLPVGFRQTEPKLPLESPIEGAVAIAYSGLEVYGFHALEWLQCHVERRRGAETGVKAVQFFEGAAVWKAVDEGAISRPALEAAYAAAPKASLADMRHDPEVGLFLIEYVDGFRAGVLNLGHARGTSVGLKLKGQETPIASAFDERSEPRFPHFAYLLKAIERMVYTGRPTYPVERTLLTSGVLDRGLVSRAKQGQRLETPELRIAYRPVDYPHAPHVDLAASPSN